MSDWVKDYRSTLEWRWFTDVPTAHLWEYIRLKAKYKDEEWKDTTIHKGTFISSVAHISHETGLSDKQVRRALNNLEKTGEITTNRTNKFTQINVMNWDKYQGCDDDEGKQRDMQRDMQRANKGNNKGQQYKEYKEYKNIRNKEKEIYKEKEMDCSPEFAEALSAYEEMRKKIRKPLTDKAKKMVLDKLGKMATDEETQIAILNQSTMNSWQGVFPLRDTQKIQEKKGLEALLDL